MSNENAPPRPLRWTVPVNMAPNVTQGQDLLPSAPAEQKARNRRRVARRKGPPQLQFVTATDPSDFKGDQAKRSVRSQAMIQYRYQSAEQKRQKSDEKLANSTRSSATTYVVRAQPKAKALVLPLNEAAGDLLESEQERDMILNHFFGNRLATSCIGNNVDPFLVIPKFTTPELNSNQLVRSCNRVFVSKQTLARWVPAMLAHPHILLSSTIMSSTWRDMVEGLCGESRRTILLKAEIISWVNERLQNVATMYHNDTIMVILHLLMGETWSCNEEALHIHVAGLARLMSARAQCEAVAGFDVVGLATVIVCTHISIICESAPLPELHQFQVPNLGLDNSVVLPESPLYCPREEMYSVMADPACSTHTYQILRDVRDVTDVFLAYSDSLACMLEEEQGLDQGRMGRLSMEYDVQLGQFRTKLARMPSAFTPGLATSNDWTYEVCRITALIHTSAIITCVPFSTAADGELNAVVRTAAASTSDSVLSRRLVESLLNVLERTNTGDVWNSMAGVFYWVCAVGAAAARAPVASETQDGEPSTWVRRCLTMFASRTLAQMIFEYPMPILAAQRKLARVQALLGRYDEQHPQAFYRQASVSA